MELTVALLVFNRPDTTRAVFEQIKRARPDRLFVIADGPRPEKPGEVERCNSVRSIIDNEVDWPCAVHKNYADVNLGCRERPPSGLDWVFDQVESCIILEDDCVPHPSFFPYCQELLERYRDDSRVMAISGDNFQFGQRRTSYSYYFSDAVHIWGWATWRRAWQRYDLGMKLWPEIKTSGWLNDIFRDDKRVRYWTKVFDDSYAGLNTWDYQWAFTCLIHRGLCILPSVNLVTNIGFGQDATHTTRDGITSRLPVEEMGFPLIHPPFMVRDHRADAFTFKLFQHTSKGEKLRTLLNRLLRLARRRNSRVKPGAATW